MINSDGLELSFQVTLDSVRELNCTPRKKITNIYSFSYKPHTNSLSSITIKIYFVFRY